jgi:ATP-dependent RNA helicase SUPV3L1/SUV3
MQKHLSPYGPSETSSDADAMSRLLAQTPFHDYPAMFPIARSAQRKFTVILGPTNSGKTHKALEALVQAESGAYLGPLRLLALEGHERITKAGVLCSLRTGEERIDVPFSAHVASTVEMADFHHIVDVAVIDEIQLLTDPDRGWAWSAAVCGLPARHIFLLGSADIGPTVERLLKRLGEPYEIIRTQRLRPLVPEPTFVPIEKVRAGDAVVVFSRKEVFLLQEMLGQRGLSSAVIYGALGPEVRRSEAERFREGKAQVLIATDAIGMGLNLPIARIIFADAWKYNGEEDEPLSPPLTKQIAGRAGRYGIVGLANDDEGRFAGMHAEAHQHVVEMVRLVTPLSVSKILVVPTPMQISDFAEACGIEDPVQALTEFGRRFLSGVDDMFIPGWSQDRIDRLRELHPFVATLGMATVMAVAQAPVPRGDWVEKVYWAAVRAMSKDRPLTLWHGVEAEEAEGALKTIYGAESVYHVASLYSWLHRAFGPRFPDSVDAQEWRQRAATALISLLQQRAKAILVDGKQVGGKPHNRANKRSSAPKSSRV